MLAGWLGKRGFGIALRIVPLVVLAYLIAREKPWTADLSSVALLPLLWIPVLNIGQMIFNAVRWRTALQDPPAFFPTLAAVYEGQLAQIVVGFGANDVVRTARLRNEGGSFASDLGPAIAERATEAVSMAVIVLGTALLNRLPTAAGVIAACLILIYLLFLAVGQRVRLANWPRVSLAISSGRASLTGGRLPILLGISLLGWVLEVVQIWITLRAFALPHDWSTALLVLVGINAFVSLPGPPGNFGTLEAGAMGALYLCGISGPTALSFVVIYHLLHVVPTAVIGAGVWMARGMTRGRAK